MNIRVIFAVTLQICIYIKHVIENKLLFNEEVLLLIHKLLFQMSKFMMLSIWDK